MTTRKHRGGFTLVEILIVVVILGILAAIVIPQFTNASESAKSSSLISQLQTIRSQLELFQVQHNGTYPALTSTWLPMISKTMATETAATDGDLAGDFGPYLQQPPINPVENSSTIAATAAAGVGWTYDNTTGAIKAVVSSAMATKLGLDTTNDVVTY
ncbi:MAG: prepilin-type N-terminal cleavage/methylation domain-containing protein [Phycisphaeraceae bacterium]